MSTSAEVIPGWVLLGSEGLWAADCLSRGCHWSTTSSSPEAADTAALEHVDTWHRDEEVVGL
jgi:hypothetical protein